MKYLKISDYVKEEVKRNSQKKLFDIFMILDEISQKKNIISFTYNKPYLLVQIGVNDYYRINLKEVK